MIKDIPYRKLRYDDRAYEIMQLHDQHGATFPQIARKCKLSLTCTLETYRRIKVKQICLYANHLSLALGYDDPAPIRAVYEQAYECYQNWTYACAYLEKVYPDILSDYRDGEPGMPLQFIENMPPLKTEWSPEEVACLVSLREARKMTFHQIAKELSITPEKARHVYDWYYHRQVLAIIQALQDQAESIREKNAIWNKCFNNGYSPKRRYEMLTQK